MPWLSRNSSVILLRSHRRLPARVLPVCAAGIFFVCNAALSQSAPALDPLSRSSATPGNANLGNAIANPTTSPGVAFLFSLEAKFAQAVATGGGKAFASFFADDAVTLSNKQAPVIGRAAIAAGTTWNAADYQLTWTPQGGQMGPFGDMGFTWGHYEGRSKDATGKLTTVTGRYMTIWKRQPDGEWKVAMDSSNEEPPDACTCTTDIKP